MRKFPSILVLLALSSSAFAGTGRPDPAEVVLLESGAPAGSQEFVVELRRLLDTPVWLGEKAEPPLSVGEAVRIGLREIEKTSGSSGGVVLSGLTLQERRLDGRASRWFYVLDFFSTRDDSFPLHQYLPVVVLMDGSCAPLRAKQAAP